MIYQCPVLIQLPNGHLDRRPLGMEGEQVAARVNRRRQEHQESKLFPHPHPAIKPVREPGVLRASVQLFDIGANLKLD